MDTFRGNVGDETGGEGVPRQNNRLSMILPNIPLPSADDAKVKK